MHRAGKGYVLGVNANHWFGSWHPDVSVAGEAREIAEALSIDIWTRLSAGHGTKGERLYDWAYCPLADLDADTFGLRTRDLLIRRNIGDGDLAYLTTWCLKDMPVETLVQIEGTRWRIEEGLETATIEFGLDHNETRLWHGWHRHVSLVMLAYAVMAAVRHQANAIAPKKASPASRQNSSAGRSRKLAPHPEAGSAPHPSCAHSRLVQLSTRSSTRSTTVTS